MADLTSIVNAIAASDAAGYFEDYSLTEGLPVTSSKDTVLAQLSEPKPGDTLNEVNHDPARRNKLIDDNNLLKGVIMDSDGPRASSRELIVRPDILNATVNNRATIETTTTEAEFTEQLMESNYNSASVKVSAPYVTASASYSDSSSYKNTVNEKTIYMSSRYLFPQGRIDFSPPGSGFQDDVQLSPAFTSAIQTALAKASPSEQREALYNIFEEYGHVFRTKVQIGGTLSAHTMDTFSRTENETEVKQDIQAGLEVAVKDWGAGVTAGHGNTQQTITTKENRKLVTKYIVNGGDYTKIQQTAEWIASTNQSDYWRVIDTVAVVPVVDMLAEPVRSTVKKLLIPLLGKWVDVERVPNTDKFPKAIYRPKDAIPSGWFWLGHTADASKALIVKPTLPQKAGRNPALTYGHEGPGLTDQPFVDIPQYAFLSTYFGGYVYNTPPGSLLSALRPGLFLPGTYEDFGDTIDTLIYIVRPVRAIDPEDECFDLQPVVRAKLPGSGNPPKPRWALRKNVVLFDSGEQ